MKRLGSLDRCHGCGDWIRWGGTSASDRKPGDSELGIERPRLPMHWRCSRAYTKGQGQGREIARLLFSRPPVPGGVAATFRKNQGVDEMIRRQEATRTPKEQPAEQPVFTNGRIVKVEDPES